MVRSVSLLLGIWEWVMNVESVWSIEFYKQYQRKPGVFGSIALTDRPSRPAIKTPAWLPLRPPQNNAVLCAQPCRVWGAYAAKVLHMATQVRTKPILGDYPLHNPR